jgi:hypothetical protein
MQSFSISLQESVRISLVFVRASTLIFDYAVLTRFLPNPRSEMPKNRVKTAYEFLSNEKHAIFLQITCFWCYFSLIFRLRSKKRAHLPALFYFTFGMCTKPCAL